MEIVIMKFRGDPMMILGQIIDDSWDPISLNNDQNL
jgi:hypothetical protein